MKKSYSQIHEEFIRQIEFITPKEIPSESQFNSYNNLQNFNPNDLSKNKNKNTSLRNSEESSSQIVSENTDSTNKSKPKKESGSDFIKKDSNRLSGSQDENPSKLENSQNQTLSKKRFGQHSNFSFFESFVREMIFQIFNLSASH